jgi:alkylation response protein AidB-like acyl-CoA dehydrogenase
MSDLPLQFPQALRGANLFALDRNLASYLEAEAGAAMGRHGEALFRFGAFAGGLADEEAEYTDRFAPPLLEPYDRAGALVNRIRLNPLAERANREVYELGAVGLNYGPDPAPFLLTFAMGYLLSQSNMSLHCPVTMTGAVAYVLDRFGPAALKARYLPALTRMDGKALTGGTWATERQGGSDVGATQTRAVAEGEPAGGDVRLYGLKWFATNPAGGLSLATARPEGAEPGTAGLGLYLVPFTLPGGGGNAIRIRRLKDKLGTKGVPTGELDLDGALAHEVAAPPSGFKLMMEALNFSRIHNALSAVGVMRRALLEAVGYALRREAFGQAIIRHPMVQEELLGILTAYEGGFSLAFEAARAFDQAQAETEDMDGPGRVWLRLVTALAKYATAEDAIAAARRALEIIGGNGYTQDYVTARLVRDAQVLTVWEGPANIQALELMRLLWGRMNGAALYHARIADILAHAGSGLEEGVAAASAGLAEVDAALALLSGDEAARRRHARRLIGLMADVLAAALLLERAGRELARGDGRRAVLLGRYTAERLAPPPRRGIVPGAEMEPNIFDALLAYDPVSR